MTSFVAMGPNPLANTQVRRPIRQLRKRGEGNEADGDDELRWYL